MLERNPSPEPSQSSVRPPQLITVGVIAKCLGTNPERVRRIISTRPHIHPIAYVNHTRLFTNETIALVRHEINAIDAKRRDRSNGGAS